MYTFVILPDRSIPQNSFDRLLPLDKLCFKVESEPYDLGKSFRNGKCPMLCPLKFELVLNILSSIHLPQWIWCAEFILIVDSLAKCLIKFLKLLYLNTTVFPNSLPCKSLLIAHVLSSCELYIIILSIKQLLSFFTFI